MIKFQIQKISGNISNLFDEKNYFFWENQKEKPINIFYMKNRGGKTLLFTMLYNALSGEKGYKINATYENILLQLESLIDQKKYTYKLCKASIELLENQERIIIDEYTNILNNHLGIYEDLIFEQDERKPRKNTLKSMFRYLFYSDHDINKKNRGENTEISLVNSHFDGYMKKPLLAYFLGLNLTKDNFSQISEYYLREEYLEKNKRKYDQYNEPYGLFTENKTEELFENYSNQRKILGDISVAIDHLSQMIQIRLNLKDENTKKEEIGFLQKQLKQLKEEKNNITHTVHNLQNTLHALSNIENEKYNKLVEKGIEETIQYYEQYKEEIKFLKTQNKGLILEINSILQQCETYIKKYIMELGFKNIHIDLSKQKVISQDARSEGEMSIIRILSGILLNSFSAQYGGKLLNICFFDAIFESIDEEQGHQLFQKIQQLYNSEIKEFLPQIFIFTTGTTDRYKLNQIDTIQVNTQNFIDFNK